MKTCIRCGEIKPETEFFKRAVAHDGLSPECKECRRKYLREWNKAHRAQTTDLVRKRREDNPTRFRTYWLRHRFGITAEEYDAMFQAQGGVCAICKQPETRNLGEGVVNMGVDHDHRTGAVRGLLCHRCNTIMGMLEDDPALLTKMIAYLEAWQA